MPSKLRLKTHELDHWIDLSDLLAGDMISGLIDGTLRHDDDVETLAGLVSLGQPVAKKIGPVGIYKKCFNGTRKEMFLWYHAKIRVGTNSLQPFPQQMKSQIAT